MEPQQDLETDVIGKTHRNGPPKAVGIADGVVNRESLQAAFKISLKAAASPISNTAQIDNAIEAGRRVVRIVQRLNGDTKRRVDQLRRGNRAPGQPIDLPWQPV